jgi:uncharacterized cupredoxin-like copper-binding protein
MNRSEMNMTFRIAALAGFSALCAVSAHADPGVSGHAREHGAGAEHAATSSGGTPGNPKDAKRTIRIEATDNAFNIKQIRVRAGETVRFVITNAGFNTHEFAIASPEENAEHRAMMRQMPNMVHHDANVITIEPSETKELVWHFGNDKTVEFSCNIKDHAEEGMRGTFRIGG